MSDYLDKEIDGPGETDFTTIVTSMTVLQRGRKLYDETVTRVTLDDEGAGAFVVVDQDSGSSEGRIQISPEEWPELRRAIDALINVAKGMG